MSNRSTDILFQLIKSLEKAEKRHFKLYIKRSSAKEDLKIIRVFDALDKMNDYDEKILLKKSGASEKRQLYNLKTHLYKEILASLRLLKSSTSIDLQLNEQFDYAHILYKKGLYLQSLRILDKVKETARVHQKFNFLTQVITLEKRIETLHITRSMLNRAGQLSEEANEVSRHIDMVARLSNLALLLYGWFIKHGHARNEKDEGHVIRFVKKNLPEDAWIQTGFYERLYLYQSYTWLAFIRQNFLLYYRYSEKWVMLFGEQPLMIRVETGHYIKGLHNLLNAHFDLRNFRKFEITLHEFEDFSKTERVLENDNFRVQCFVYVAGAKINWHCITGTFKEGLKLVPEIEKKLEEDHLFIDQHRILVLNYKMAILFFGSGNYETCIDHLQKIINSPTDLRDDLQCYARLVHLIAHYEMGNLDIIESLARSTYRFMAKKETLTLIEEEMLKFLRKSFDISSGKIKPELASFLEKVKHLEKNRFETRVFAYLDVISWLEAKTSGKTMSEVINEKYMMNKRK